MGGTVERYGIGWRYRFELPRDPATGRRRFASKAGFATEREAKRALAKALSDADEGRHVPRNGYSVGEWLDEWLERARLDLKATTAAGYGHGVDKVKRAFGQTRLQDLTPLMVENFYASLMRTGLSAKTVLNTHTLLRRALSDAERLGLIIRNPAATARPPRVQRKEQKTWTPEEVSAFLRIVSHDRWFAAFVVLATTGMRRGEVLGLRWADIDLDSGVASVVHTYTTMGGAILESTTKTLKSRRRIALDTATVLVLRRHRARQAEERLFVGPAWREQGLVFTEPDGSVVHPDKLTRLFGRLVDESPLPKIRLHDLRHTHATMALRAGVHPKVVSERLGHATVGITLDLYSHVTPGLDQQAAEKIAGLLDIDATSLNM